MPIAEGGQTRGLPGWFRPGVGNLSLEHCQLAHRLAVVTVAFTQHRDGREVEIDRICKATLRHFPPLPSCSAYFDYIGIRCTDLEGISYLSAVTGCRRCPMS
jgi:hypothetical protein